MRIRSRSALAAGLSTNPQGWWLSAQRLRSPPTDSVTASSAARFAPSLRGRIDLPLSAKRLLRDNNRSRIASAIVASPIHACQCSTGSWLVTIVARVPARSSMISIRSDRVVPSSAASPQSSSSSTSVRATIASQRPKPPLPCRMRSSSARRGLRRYNADCPRRQA